MVADQSSSIVTVSWTLGSISIVLVTLRLYSRVVLTRRRGWDDFFIAFSLANAIVCSALAQVGVSYGLGKHISDIPDPGDQKNAIKYTVIAPNFSVVSTTTGKISVAIFLFRLMGQSAKLWQKWFLYILTVVSIAWNVLAIIVIIGFCRPAKKIWIPDTPGSCFSLELQLVGGTSQAAFNAFADLALALFPVVIFRKVQLHVLKKIGIIAILGAGIFAAAATLVKCILLKNLPEHADMTWSWAPITTWYSVEMYVIIICATLPTLPQGYNAILDQRSRYYNTTISAAPRSGQSEAKNKLIRLQRMPDASLFETQAEGERNGSQESMLDHQKPGPALSGNFKKMTEVTVVQESRESAEQEDDDPKYFPRQNPFCGSDSGNKGTRTT
ncbi:hypothetical protein BDV06DRAFT_228249 [Aspergillus oleicola]